MHRSDPPRGGFPAKIPTARMRRPEALRRRSRSRSPRRSETHMKRTTNVHSHPRPISRSPPPIGSVEYDMYREKMSESERKIIELEEKIKRLDKSLAANSSKFGEEYPRSSHKDTSRPRSKERDRSRYNNRSNAQHEAEAEYERHMGMRQPSPVQIHIEHEPKFSNYAYTQSYLPVDERLSFPPLWTKHDDIVVDPVPVYPTDLSPEGNGFCFEDAPREVIPIEIHIPPSYEANKRSSGRSSYAEEVSKLKEKEEERMVAKQAEAIKKKHFEEVRKREAEEKERRKRKEEQKKTDDRKIEREKRHLEQKKKEDEIRSEREKRRLEARKEEDERKKRESERGSRKRPAEEKSSSKPPLAVQRALTFLEELKVSLGPLVFDSKCEKKNDKSAWTTTCHITNIPKELISATSIGKSTKESSQHHSVERFIDKLVYFGLLTKTMKEGLSKYKALPVFLAGIIDSYCNDVAIYGTQMSVTEDRDMVKKFTNFVKEKSEEFWEAKQSIVDAFLKCQSVDSGDSSTSDSAERKRKEEKEREERRREREKERKREEERKRDKDRERRRERDDRSKNQRRSTSPLNTERFTKIAQSLLSQQYAQMIQPLTYAAQQPAPPGIPGAVNYLPSVSQQQMSNMYMQMPNQQMPINMQMPQTMPYQQNQQQPGFTMSSIQNSGYPLNNYQGPPSMVTDSSIMKPQSLMGPPVKVHPAGTLLQLGQSVSHNQGRNKNKKRNSNGNDEVDLMDEVFK